MTYLYVAVACLLGGAVVGYLFGGHAVVKIKQDLQAVETDIRGLLTKEADNVANRLKAIRAKI